MKKIYIVYKLEEKYGNIDKAMLLKSLYRLSVLGKFCFKFGYIKQQP